MPAGIMEVLTQSYFETPLKNDGLGRGKVSMSPWYLDLPVVDVHPGKALGLSGHHGLIVAI